MFGIGKSLIFGLMLAIILVPAVSAYPTLDVNTIALYYSNDSSTPTVLWGRNQTGDSFNGTFLASGEPTYVSPNGLLFDSDDDYVKLPGMLDTVTNNGTIEMLINPTNEITGTSGGSLLFKQNTASDIFQSYFIANGSIAWRIAQQSEGSRYLYSTTQTWNAGEDYHVKLIWGNATGMMIIINDTVEANNTAYNFKPYNGTYEDYYYGNYYAGSTAFEGTMKYLHISNQQEYTAPGAINITIHLPENKTYNNNLLYLNVSSPISTSAWNFSIDNQTGNISFTPNTTIDLGAYLSGSNILGAHNITVCTNATIDSKLYCASEYFTFAYVVIEAEDYPTSVFETDDAGYWADFDIFNWSAVSSMDANLMWNYTLYSPTMGTGNNYSKIVEVPLTASGETINFYWNYTVCYLWGTCVEYNSTLRSTTINLINLTSCTGADGENVTLIFIGWNESNVSMHTMNFVMGISVQIGLNSKYYNYSFNGNDTYKLCISPSDEEYIANIDIEYQSTGYPIRYYYLRRANLTNSISQVNLYLLHDDDASQTDHTVQDTNYQDQEGLVVKAMRYFPGLGSYNVVGMGLTGPNGETSIFLKRDVYYKFVIENNGTVLKMSSPETLTNLNIIHYVSVDRRDVFFQYYGSIASNCQVDKTNFLIICTYSDTSGKLLDVTLTAKEVLLYNRTEDFCTETSTSAADTLVCNYGSYVNSSVKYILEGHFHGSGEEWFVLFMKMIQATTTGPWGRSLGSDGLFLTVILIMAFTLIGAADPRIAVVMSGVGAVASFLLGLYIIAIPSLIGLLIAAGFLVYKMRD